MARPMESTVESCDGGDDRRMEPVIHLESEATSVPPGDLAIVLTGGGVSRSIFPRLGSTSSRVFRREQSMRYSSRPDRGPFGAPSTS